MPLIHLPETDLFYEEAGSGPPLLLVPGFASGAWSWAWQMPELSRYFRVIVFDPRGVSRSTLGEGASAVIEKIADDLEGLIKNLHLTSAYVMGISFGGFVAQEFALKYPGRVTKLVLASTGFGGPNHVLPSPEVLASFATTADLNSPERIRKYLSTAFSREFLKANPTEVERFCDLREKNPVPEDVYRHQLGSAMLFNTENRVGRISAETLVITGDADSVVPPQNSLNLAAKIPDSRIEMIRGAGHMAFVERACEFNQLVRNFLSYQK